MDRHEVRYSGNPQTVVDRAPAGPELLDVEGVAVRLGVTARHVRRLVAERRIPFIKWGRLLRFDPADVESWIAKQRIEALPPLRGSRSGTVR
ncbi:MAG: helix-turn-helix domain-containing protein [Acidimicrobiia bacterium]